MSIRTTISCQYLLKKYESLSFKKTTMTAIAAVPVIKIFVCNSMAGKYQAVILNNPNTTDMMVSLFFILDRIFFYKCNAVETLLQPAFMYCLCETSAR